MIVYELQLPPPPVPHYSMIHVCLTFYSEGKIAAVGLNSEIKDLYIDKCDQVYDATDQCIIPGISSVFSVT